MNNRPLIGVIGGTGALGAALARRWAKAGEPVLIGSRDGARAAQAAETLQAELGAQVGHGSNEDVAARSQILVVTVPWAAQADTLEQIREHAAGKLVIDTTVPLVPPKVMRVQVPEEGSAGLRAKAILGDDVTVATAFHNVAADKLARDGDLDCDVLIFSDDKDAREETGRLVVSAGLRGFQAGSLANSIAAEAMTSLLIFINKTYKIAGAGIRITGC
nr:NADPH-dependent F420 reductase [Sphingomonas sp. CDS-1]